jgi:hypothetical protein
MGIPSLQGLHRSVISKKQKQSAYTSTLPIRSSTLESTITDVDSKEKNNDEFDWFKSWHPIVPVEFLDPSRPHAFKLLGMDIVSIDIQ